MKYEQIVDSVFRYVKNYDKENDFQTASDNLNTIISGLSRKELLPIINQFGIIPEKIEHDSKEEKLYTKVSEIVLARCLSELGYKTTLYITRGDSADVLAKSPFHNYTLVSDAKAFRLSRTAKNQKDFKVEAMDAWRGDNDYAVLCCPYFQYPKSKSAIYKQAIEKNVALFSWEWFTFLIEHKIRENESTDLSFLWDFGKQLSQKTLMDKANENFLGKQDEYILRKIGFKSVQIKEMFDSVKHCTISRGKAEITYWQTQIDEIKQYDRQKAVNELIIKLKLNEKINTIKKYIEGLENA